jgi:capsular exopolysaccharide synthesis family protein
MERIKQALEIARQEREKQSGEAKTAQTPRQPATGSGSSQAAKSAAADKAPREIVYTQTRTLELNPAHLEHHRVVSGSEATEDDAYKLLRTQVLQRMRVNNWQTLAITSPNEGAGKTLTAINLAGALAKDTGTQVLLLDLDLRHRPAGGVSEYLGMRAQDGEGAVDWIRETEYGYEQFVHYLHPYNLHVMTAGSEPELPYELLKSTRLDQLIRRARRDYDFVVIDTPQILRLPDTELIARVVDGFVVVVKANVTKQERLEEALNLMRPDKVFGMVFNADTEKR